MIAAKAFDPVVGVDIHIIQPPGPVPPIPVPHPFIGILLDPFDFAPIIGSTVSVNGLPRATAGTGGRCLPPHIPIGGVFVKPPANECDVFMGSSTVLADDEPLSFLGMPALSCHCIGMPPIPRLKKKRRVKSLVLPTTFVIAIPMGMPVLVGGPPTVSMMALGMKAGMALLGKVFKKLRKLQKASRRIKALSDKIQNAAKKLMNKLGVPPSVQNRVSRAICSVTGHPVDVATGKMFTECVDFELPGPLPLRWERVWYSCSTYDGPLGYGWHHPYDMALTEEEGSVALRMADGRPVGFPALDVGQTHFDRRERLTLLRDSAGYAVQDERGRLFRFHVAAGTTIQPLVSITDRNGNQIRFQYDGNHALRGITDSAGRHVTVERDAAGRIVGLLAPLPGRGSTSGRVVTYRYDDHGNLVEAMDAHGHPLRYVYDDQHLMVREIDRDGMSFHFEYQHIGGAARCVRTWGDGGLYAREISYALDAQVTTVLDGRGGTWTYHWNELGLVTTRIDPLGNVTTTEFNEYGDKVAESDAAGGAVTYEYDEAGRLVTTIDAVGAVRTVRYDAAGNPAVAIDPLGLEWRREFDDRGNVVAFIDPAGTTFRVTVEERGYPVAITDPFGRQSLYEWDGEGNPVRRVDRAGAMTTLEYDASGHLLQRVDATGARKRFAWDDVGNLIGIEDAEGRVARFTYDAARNLTSAIDPAGRVRRYAHGPRARITRLEEANGEVTEYRYDVEGELTVVRDARGALWTFEYDPLNRVVVETDFTGRRLRYRYDGNGGLIAVENGRGQVTTMKRDPAGRLVERTFADGEQESFVYDAKSRLTIARNPAAALTFRYDAHGRVLDETMNGERVSNTYDLLGNRVERITPMGSPLEYRYDEANRLAHLADPVGTLFEFRYDAVGRETRRTMPSDVVSERQYARTGELLQQSTRRANGGTVLDRKYSYNVAGELIGVDDMTLGPISFDRDVNGFLTATIYPEGRIQSYLYDRAGNATGAPSGGGRSPGDPSGYPTQVGEWRLRFDADGNLVEKLGRARGYQFSYSPAGRLVRADSTDGSTVEYAYDPLGRRIRKTTPSRTVDYMWDRDFLVFERVRQGTPSDPAPPGAAAEREFVFRSDCLVPIAVRESQRTLLIETDQIGLPRLAIDRDGHVAWEGDFGGFGENVRAGASGAVPFRFPGQLADEETGLYYNRFRYYDPELRMYTQPDPLGLAGGEHPHNYVADPTHWTDPLGLTDLDDPGHSVYLLEKKNPATGQWEPYYTGISNDPTRRLDEHIDDGRISQAGIDDGDLRMRTVESDLTYAQARGYEQAYMDHHQTRTASPGDTVAVGTGNKVNSFDSSRTDARGKAFEKHRKAKSKALAACP